MASEQIPLYKPTEHQTPEAKVDHNAQPGSLGVHPSEKKKEAIVPNLLQPESPHKNLPPELKRSNPDPNAPKFPDKLKESKKFTFEKPSEKDTDPNAPKFPDKLKESKKFTFEKPSEKDTDPNAPKFPDKLKESKKFTFEKPSEKDTPLVPQQVLSPAIREPQALNTTAKAPDIKPAQEPSMQQATPISEQRSPLPAPNLPLETVQADRNQGSPILWSNNPEPQFNRNSQPIPAQNKGTPQPQPVTPVQLAQVVSKNTSAPSRQLPPEPTAPQQDSLGNGMCLAPGAPVATFGDDKHSVKVADRLPRTFDSVDAATAYARSLGQPATVIDEGNNAITVYTIDPASFEQTRPIAAGRGGAYTGVIQTPFTGSAVQLDDQSDQTNVKSTNGAMQAIITEDGFQLRPGESGGMYLADFAQQQGQDQQGVAKELQQNYAGQRKAFGDGLQDIKDKDQFLKQYNLSLRDTAFNLLRASELEAQQKQKSFENGLPATEAPKIHSVSTRLEDLDRQLEEATINRVDADLKLQDSGYRPQDENNPLLAAHKAADDRVKTLEQQRDDLLKKYPTSEAQKSPDVSAQLEDLDRQLGEATIDRVDAKLMLDQSGYRPQDDANNPLLAAKKAADKRVQELEQERKAVLAEYPLLERINPADFNKLSEAEQAKILHDACGDVLNDISTTRQNIVKGKIDLIQLSPLVTATNEGLGIQPEQAQWVAEKASSDKNWDTAGKIGLGALALGLGIAATFATGGLALALGIGALGVGITDAAITTDEYFTNQAATNTDVDPNQSLMPQDMKGHWGWVVASWVGAGLDLGAAVKAARLLKAGMTVDEVIKVTSQSRKIPEEVLRTAYDASGTASSDPKVLKEILTSALPREIAQQTQEGLKVTVLEPAEFFERFGSASSDAATLLRQGKNGLETEVFVRKGADPVSMLEEAAHVAQSTDKTLAPKMAKLSEENLANWSKMTPQEQADLYKIKLELEIDAQKRLLQQFGEGDRAYQQGGQQTLDNLESRLAEVELGIKNPESLKGKPWLDPAQPPRLFSKTPMSDKQLIGAVENGFANPQHMSELLARTDLSAAQLEKSRDALSVAFRSGKYSPENLQVIISKLKSSAAKDTFDEVLAELSHSNRLVKSGQVAEGTQVVLGAKQGKEYKLGTQTVKTDPVPEADVLYLGTDGKIHLDEVKNTANALRDKVADSDQLKRLLEWRAEDPQNRAINFAIESENKWTDLFAPNNGQGAVLQQLEAQNIPLTIGSKKLSPEKIGELWDATLAKSKQMQTDGTWKGWKNFYSYMDTLSNTEKFLGISL
jgi:hypothetical protein